MKKRKWSNGGSGSGSLPKSTIGERDNLPGKNYCDFHKKFYAIGKSCPDCAKNKPRPKFTAG